VLVSAAILFFSVFSFLLPVNKSSRSPQPVSRISQAATSAPR